MTLDPFQYRDPADVLAAAVGSRPLRAGDLLLALVRDPSGDQVVVRTRLIPRTRRRHIDDDERSRLLADYAERLKVPRLRSGTAPRHSIMTITARRGYAVIGPDEAAWLKAWLYSNHRTGAFSGDLIVVTEHGWADVTTGWGGATPRIEPN